MAAGIKIFMQPIIILPLLINIGLTWCQFVTGSGHETWLEKTECALPDSRPYDVNATEENMNNLVHEGRCFLICLEDDDMFEDIFIRNEDRTIWPYPTIKTDNNCPSHTSRLHECIRGCRIRFENPEIQTCGSDCESGCRTDCSSQAQCIISNASTVWTTQTGCNISCNLLHCQSGCNHGSDRIKYGFKLPSLPNSQPEFKPLNNTDERGLISVTLTSDDDEGDLYLTGTLFQIKDLLSNNLTYIWQNDLTKPLNISGYACRAVNISLCLVNPNGRTNFTEPFQLYIEGDEPQIPHAPVNVQVVDEMDKHIFQHTVLNIKWKSPQNDTHLKYYVVKLTPNISCNSSKTLSSQEVVYQNSTREYFITLSANHTVGAPLMGCTYTTEVIAVGNHGSNSSSILHTVRSLQEFTNEILTNFTCEKRIAVYPDSPKPYFIFNLKWTMVSHMDSVNRFGIVYRIYNTRTKQESNAEDDKNHTILNGVYTSYSTTYMKFSQPRRNPDDVFLFKLRIHWNQEDILLDSYNCTLNSLSPAPTNVQHFKLNNFEVVSPNEARVNASWTRPPETNGILSKYKICLSRYALEGNELASEHGTSCLNVSDDKTSINANLYFDFSSNDNHAYIQIQPENTYVAGNWSESHLIFIPSKFKVTELAVGISLGIVLVVITIAAVSYYKCRVYSYKMKYTEYDKTNFIPLKGITSIMRDIQPKWGYDNYLTDKWEISPSHIVVEGELGHGEFGVVKKGHLRGHLLNNKVKVQLREASCVPVAIKMLKYGATGSDRENFLSEIEMMKKVSKGHNPHVVAMLGCVTTQEPLYLVTEFVKYGDLHSYLLSNRKINQGFSPEFSLTPVDLVNFSYQISDGMDFISSKGIMHCDLACRNILVAEGKVLKIADFGLSCERGMYKKCKRRCVPLKWMPIEFLEKEEITTSSDIWSFGVVLWEIATLGGNPYPDVKNAELLSFLKAGNRLEKPENTCTETYKLMQSCWNKEPSKRPKFDFLKHRFSDILLSQRSSNHYVILGESVETEHSVIKKEELMIPKSSSLSFLSSNKDLVFSRSISLDVDLQKSLADQNSEFHPANFDENLERHVGISHQKSLGVVLEQAAKLYRSEFSRTAISLVEKTELQSEKLSSKNR